MKKFETPEIEIEKFMIEDVVTTSDYIPGEDHDDENVGPIK